MAELRPHPFSALVTRMLRDHARGDAIYDLPARRWWRADPERDLSVRFHGRRAATALGPAAGPQSQMAQNLVLSWLGGCRIMELKTVQVDDELAIPRPCIDMQTVGFNVEWSQELKLPQSLDEYVKGAMLIRMLAHEMGVSEEDAATIHDMSVGYDLKGVRSGTVQAFIAGMGDATDRVDAFRREIPTEWSHLRDLDYDTELSRTLTLSTFHGCPPDEIEGMCRFLLEERGLHTIVKLNPMLLGPDRARELLNDVLGYEDLRIPDEAFTRDTTWPQMIEFVGRLGDLADRLGLGFGVKFTNTLIVENHRAFFPDSEREMYLSGPPLHVLAMVLVRRFRRTFGDRFPISFSAGVDARNFADAVGLGLVPVTTCSDLLKPGGYGRARGYLDELSLRMASAEADDVNTYVRNAPDADGYVEALLQDPRYHADRNVKVPRKIGSTLELFDCITCDKCVPVCPNDANFTLPIQPLDLPIKRLVRAATGWNEEDLGVFQLTEKHQIANFADFCNDCGNCDVFCPEDGGPYILKPRFFGTLEDWIHFDHLDGFHVAGKSAIHGRVDGKGYVLDDDGYAGEGFRVDEDGTVTADDTVTSIELLPREILRVMGDSARASGGWIAPVG